MPELHARVTLVQSYKIAGLQQGVATILAHAIHQPVQNNVEVNVLTTVHQLSDHTPDLMPAEAHVDNVVNNLI